MTHLSPRDLVRANNAIHGESAPLPAPRKRRNNEESQIQQGVIRYWSQACQRYNVEEFLLFKISNEGWRSPALGAIMKREGLRAGAPDLMLAIPRRGLAGMFIELKGKDGRVSPEQRKFIMAANTQGYRALVCYCYEDAIEAIEEYLA